MMGTLIGREMEDWEIGSIASHGARRNLMVWLEENCDVPEHNGSRKLAVARHDCPECYKAKRKDILGDIAERWEKKRRKSRLGRT